MKKFITVVLVLLVIGSVSGLIRYLGGLAVTNQTPTIDRTSYLRIAEKSCATEAVKGGLRQADAEGYCKCASVKIYGSKSIEEIQAIDKEFINGAIPEKYDQVVIDCMAPYIDNYL